MNDKEIIAWLDMLHDRNRSKKDIIEELLKCSAEDDMSMEDAATCHRGLELLNLEAGAAV